MRNLIEFESDLSSDFEAKIYHKEEDCFLRIDQSSIKEIQSKNEPILEIISDTDLEIQEF